MRPVLMKTREFLHLLPDLVRQQLPSELKEFQVTGSTMTLVKLHYGDPSIHYEAWIQRRKGELELGLHFEGDPVTNRHYLRLLNQHLGEIQSVLGKGVEVEEWARSWTRAHRTLPLQPLTDDFLVEVSVELSETMKTLEPLLTGQG
jgi:hypothetical protein